ncbi:MAG: hypothetical protein PUB87_03440 [Eubacteriaceae bacterium]|nr:hypothetical protein [Eubacteriaceae bacterium]
MAFMDKLGQVANKAAAAAGEGIEFGKAKAKIIQEKGIVKDAKEALGEYVYLAIKSGEEIDVEKAKEYISTIDEHLDIIAKLESDAQESKDEIKDTFKEF